MKNNLLALSIAVVGVSLCAILVISIQYATKHQKIQADLKSHVERVAEYLDSQTTETGAYIKSSPKEVDATGRELLITYTRGGLAEEVEVRACGVDELFYTSDDVFTTRHSVNLTGVGNGIKNNVEEVTKRGMSGAVQGLKDGIKKSFKKEEK